MGRGGKVVFKRGGGSGGWDRGARARCGGCDTDDDEYVVGEDEEEISDDSYSSDASLEASQDAEQEEEEEDESDWLDEEDMEAAARRRRTKGMSGPTRKPAAKPLRGKRSSVTDEGGETEDSPIGKPRARRRRRPEVFAEGEDDEIEEEEEDDEDFAPDEDEDDEEEFTTALARKSSYKRRRPAKRQQRRIKPRKSQVAEKKKEKALGRKRGRRRTAPGSDDDDFIVKDRVSVDGADRKKRGLSNGRKRRRSLSSSSDPSDSSASDVDYTISVDELRDLQVGGALGHRARMDLSSGVQGGKKGKGKEVDDVGKQVCGICLSEEHNRVIRGLLDCCAHYFCFACIMEWSKVESKCPVCKRRFMTVSKSARLEAGFGLRTAVIRIPIRDQVYQPSEEEIRGYLDPYANVVCLVCQQGGDDNLMLLCDICDSSAHTYCVGLMREVPEGNWYCDGCRYTDPDSSNLRVQDSALEHGTSHGDMLHEEFSGGVNSDNIMGHMPPAITQQSSSLSCVAPSSQGTAQDTSNRCQMLSGDHGTTSYVSGFAASTLSGRRSIHQRIRIILSNNRVRSIPVVARNNVIQPSFLESCLCDFETRCNEDLHPVPQESLTNGVNERKSTSFPGPRIGMNSHIPNEGNSCCSSESAKKQVKSTVKRHLNHLTRDTSLGRRDLKEISGHATHTILAACGFEHRPSKVTTIVQVPSDCVHLADGDHTSLVKGCCSSCFASFVENVVQEILNSKLRSACFHA
ncbi:hypothetical protein Taro_008131 [Colocasia esculenta]|uniref:PHD and RING finger domain-containing protein 1 n=1 Tax=Colocasia esculenta TaxID=4460 RepID=A0A843U288_COLES|nr:hypothetical protein [Colocasia esculenta]